MRRPVGVRRVSALESWFLSPVSTRGSADSGQAMGQGLTPFAIICENHAEGHAAIKASAAADSDLRPGLKDVCAIMSTDIRLPTNPHRAVEKLKDWSILLDCMIGATHPVAIATRNFAMMASSAIAGT